jgi:hypothetical protein
VLLDEPAALGQRLRVGRHLPDVLEPYPGQREEGWRTRTASRSAT